MNHPDHPEKPTQHGGARPGAGRPPRETPAAEPKNRIPPDQPKQWGGVRPGAGIRLTKRKIDGPGSSWIPTSQAQVDMWTLLGGAAWLRSVLDEEIAKEN